MIESDGPMPIERTGPWPHAFFDALSAPTSPGFPPAVAATENQARPTASNPAPTVVAPPPLPDPVLCGHCGRTASNGLSCIGMCVADSGY